MTRLNFLETAHFQEHSNEMIFCFIDENLLMMANFILSKLYFTGYGKRKASG